MTEGGSGGALRRIQRERHREGRAPATQRYGLLACVFSQIGEMAEVSFGWSRDEAEFACAERRPVGAKRAAVTFESDLLLSLAPRVLSLLSDLPGRGLRVLEFFDKGLQLAVAPLELQACRAKRGIIDHPSQDPAP